MHKEEGRKVKRWRGRRLIFIFAMVALMITITDRSVMFHYLLRFGETCVGSGCVWTARKTALQHRGVGITGE